MEEGEGRIEEGCGKEKNGNLRTERITSDLYGRQEQECHLWLKQRLTPRKTASIMTVIEQMVETRGWKVARELIEDGRCRLCHELLKPLNTLLLDVRR